MSSLPRPTRQDAADYYFTYIDQVPAGDVLALLAGNLARTRELLADLTPEQERHRYAPGKWTVREVVGHMLDTERVFGYRAFHIARGDKADLPGMEQDDYGATAGHADRPLEEILQELEHVRRGHLALFASLGDPAWRRAGIASGVVFRVSALPYIMVGHETHHRRVLAERYLTS